MSIPDDVYADKLWPKKIPVTFEGKVMGEATVVKEGFGFRVVASNLPGLLLKDVLQPDNSFSISSEKE